MSIHVKSYAETVSVTTTFVEGDQFGATFAANLNTNTVELENGINNIRGLVAGTIPSSGQILKNTIGADNMADEAHPATRLCENFREYVEDGLTIPTDTDLTVTIAAGTAYPECYRVDKTSGTEHTFTSGVDTYVDIDTSGDFQYSEVALGATAPAIATNSVRIAKVSTDGGTVNTVTDLRTLTLFDTGEGESLQGMRLNWTSNDQVTIDSGYARDDGAAGTNYTIETTVSTTIDIDDSGLSGLDSGSKAASTWYAVYAIGAKDDSQTEGFIFSTDFTNVSFPTNYDIQRRIGAVYVDADIRIASFDQAGQDFFFREGQIDVDEGTATTSTSFTATVPSTAHGAFVGAIQGSTGATDNEVFVSPVSLELNTTKVMGPGMMFAGNTDDPTFTASGFVPIDTAQTLYYDLDTADNIDIVTLGFRDDI